MKCALCTLTPKPYIKSSFFATEFVVFFFLCPVCPVKWTNIFCAAGAYWFERCKMLPGDAWRTRHLGIHQRFQTRKVQTQRNAAAGLIWLIMHKNTGRSLNSYWHLLRYAELASQHGTYYVILCTKNKVLTRLKTVLLNLGMKNFKFVKSHIIAVFCLIFFAAAYVVK